MFRDAQACLECLQSEARRSLSIEQHLSSAWVQDIDQLVRGTGAVDGVTDQSHRPMRQSRFQGGDGCFQRWCRNGFCRGPDQIGSAPDASAREITRTCPHESALSPPVVFAERSLSAVKTLCVFDQGSKISKWVIHHFGQAWRILHLLVGCKMDKSPRSCKRPPLLLNAGFYDKSFTHDPLSSDQQACRRLPTGAVRLAHGQIRSGSLIWRQRIPRHKYRLFRMVRNGLRHPVHAVVWSERGLDR